MSDATAVPTGATPAKGDPQAANPANPPIEAADEWKPEPRQWTWKDLFTAPMLAFKPKCMLVSAIAVIVIGLWYQLLYGSITPHVAENLFLIHVLNWVWNTVALMVFSLLERLWVRN